ncbi:MAG: hypothetical protein IK127_00580 [Clostridia bacterium]|nr:hypothetical protein [Clostridia bacterium]
MDKLFVSERFDLDDIRRIRDNNSSRHMEMTHAEIVADIHNGAAKLMNDIINRPTRKPITILSGNHKTVINPITPKA